MVWRRRSETESGPSMAERQFLLPYWWDRRINPDSPAYDAVGAQDSNTTERTWTLLGALGSASRGAVDPRGFLSTGGGCGIDWWIRANDQWHRPSDSAAVRQSCVEGVPVVETRLRVAGGEVIQTVGAVAGGDGQLVIEFQNNTDAAVALAIAVRPVDLVGPTRIGGIEFDGAWLWADGKRIVGFPREPGLLAGGTASGDVGQVSTDEGDGGSAASLPIECSLGMAHAVVSLPLVHSATIRLVAPLHVDGERGAIDPSTAAVEPSMAPSLDRVVSGWQAQTQDGARFVIPAGRWRTVYEQARRSLRLFSIEDTFVSDPIGGERAGASKTDWVDGRLIAAAHDQMGWHRESAEVLLGIAETIDRHGAIGNLAGTAAAMDALWNHHELSGVAATTQVLADSVIGATRYLTKTNQQLPTTQLNTDEASRSHAAVVGLESAARLLEALGEGRAAADARESCLSRPESTGVVDAATACERLRLSGVDDASEVGASAVSQLQSLPGLPLSRFSVPLGHDIVSTALLAAHELADRSSKGLERLAWLVDAASSTGAWPAATHALGGGGIAGDGHHGASVAAMVSLFRSVLIVEHGSDSSISLVPVLPPHWLGQNFEVHDAPTRFGIMSYAVRWHAKRPALLWDLKPHDGADSTRAITIRCPGLDAGWSTTDLVGEVLLAGPPDESKPDTTRLDVAQPEATQLEESQAAATQPDGGFS